jgi:hypothetical protein
MLGICKQYLGLARRSAALSTTRKQRPELLAYQKIGVEQLLKHKRLILADEMGLGKTAQAICALNGIGKDKLKVLIVCPLTIIPVWTQEMKLWLERPHTIGAVTPGGLPETEIAVVNYEQLRKLRPALMARGNFDVIIADEAHYLKSPQAQRTMNLLGDTLHPASGPESLKPIPADRLWLLTGPTQDSLMYFYPLFDRCIVAIHVLGTPMLNHPIDLFPLLKAVDPDAEVLPHLLSYYAFR